MRTQQTNAAVGRRGEERSALFAAGAVAGLLALGLVLSRPAFADVEIDGFVEADYGVATVEERPQGDIMLSETRGQVRLSSYGERGDAFLRLDVLHDRVANDETEIELREGYLRFTLFDDNLEAKVGRQPLTWGTGDLLFVNDLFPKDWVSFFAGRDDQYLKAPVDALRLGLFNLPFTVDLVLMPEFTPDRTPTGERLTLAVPEGITAGVETPSGTIEDGEVALRLSRYVGGASVALYGYYGYFPTPQGVRDAAAKTTALGLYHPELSVYGASARGAALSGVYSLEAGYYDSREDRAGDDPQVPNSSLRHIAGFERQVAEDLTASVQHYGEWMQDFGAYEDALPEGAAAADEYRQLVTLRLEKLVHYQTVRLSLFGFWSPTDEDGHGRALVSYDVSDEVKISVGANVFTGDSRATTFGMLDDDDNVFTRVRYSF
ncbi:MAG: hypothetical protein HKN20_11580 [Gemmatimonadetes bacterium]|nr:hypothetical protein [Gemmatimonadota bacterium]